MKQGDKIKATWSDGLVLIGHYVGIDRGYIILMDKGGKKIACNQDSVTFEVISEGR